MKSKIELTKKQKFLAAAGTGLLILVILWPASEKTPAGMSEDKSGAAKESTGQMAGEGESLEAYIDRQEERLAAVLSEIDGVGAVYVMITASASRELVVEKNVTEEADVTEEEDTNGGRRSVKNNTRSEVSVTDYTSGTAMPYVVKSLEPEIEGIAVAAKGAGTVEVETEIIHTVQALFDVPVHKIKVVKMK